MPSTILRICVACGLLATCASWVSAADRAPNFVVIFIDDLGYGDIGPYGATKQKTPNLDRMAKEGMMLTSFYAAPVCSVSRAQLMTGCYGARVSVPGVFSPASTNGLHPEEQTIADYLKRLGYNTMCIGKWHLGDQPPFLPTRQGFDRYLGIPYSNDMQRVASANSQRVVPLIRNESVEELLQDEDQSKLVELYTQEAIQFIDQQKDHPFFLYLPHNAVHTPIHPGKAFQGRSSNGRFGDWVEEVDWSVGKILDHLKQKQLANDTLVLFTSDNGPWLVKGSDGGQAGPLRGGKGSTWEGGVRVPTVAWWPGHVPAQSRCDAVAGTIDVLPTLVNLAGGQVHTSTVIDGRDIQSLLFGKSTRSPREAHYYFAGYNLQAVRQGPWKLAIAPQKENRLGETEDPESGLRLYNLDQEIGERTNVASKHPDIVERLQQLASTMASEIGGTNPKSRRPPGTVPNAQTLYPSQTPAKANTPSSTKPVDWNQAKLGAEISSASLPSLQDHAFSVQCEFQTTPTDGVLFAHGGISAGYALHVQDRKITFSFRTANDEITHIASEPLAMPPRSLEVKIGKDKQVVIIADGKSIAKGTVPRLLPRHPQEDFCIGLDNARPITRYSNNEAWKGELIRFRLDVLP